MPGSLLTKGLTPSRSAREIARLCMLGRRSYGEGSGFIDAPLTRWHVTNMLIDARNTADLTSLTWVNSDRCDGGRPAGCDWRHAEERGAVTLA
ncbi:hypothetical protein GCM10009780_73060 [Actinomadura alba]